MSVGFELNPSLDLFWTNRLVKITKGKVNITFFLIIRCFFCTNKTENWYFFFINNFVFRIFLRCGFGSKCNTPAMNVEKIDNGDVMLP